MDTYVDVIVKYQEWEWNVRWEKSDDVLAAAFWRDVTCRLMRQE
jgi:hypothetical protein